MKKQVKLAKYIYFALTTLICIDAFAAGPVRVIGSGNDSCGTWTKERKTQIGWYQASQWMFGYHAAVQDLLPKGVTLKKADSDALNAFLDKYCADNPLSTVRQAMTPLITELLQKE